MPQKEYSLKDPFEMVGIQLPNQSETQLRDMALCFAEEFVREGWDKDKIHLLFHHPFYQGPYSVWKQKGDDFVRSVIEEAIKMWCPVRRTQ